MTTADLPALNAILNATSGVLLVIGRDLIKKGRRESHRKVMIAAVIVSAAFFISYGVYHSLHGSTRFGGPPGVRLVYLTILISHTTLAVLNLPLVIVTLTRALRGRFPEHKRLARWTWGTWMYVSVTGVVIYLMLYQFWPPMR